jgi:transcriptional regulator CtsR
MLTAKQARDLKSSLMKQHSEVQIYKILKSVAEEAIEPNSRSYVSADFDHVDSEVDYIAERLSSMGYSVEVEKYPEDGCSSLTVRF